MDLESSCLHSDANILSHRHYNVSCLNRAVNAPACNVSDGVTQSVSLGLRESFFFL